MPADLESLRPFIKAALEEDIGSGDVTSNALVPEDARCSATFIARHRMIVAGLPVAAEVFAAISGEITFEYLAEEGDSVEMDSSIARIEGPARAILAGERTALNLLQRACGIATATRSCVDSVAGSGAKIMDTRKTTPCWRTLEKYAVRMGGGVNHRVGLYDQVLIKDNHIHHLAANTGKPTTEAIRLARKAVGDNMKIEIEAETLHAAIEAAEAGADIVMLDNMDCAAMSEAVRRIRALSKPACDVEIEASGGIEIDELAKVAATGVDRISLGCLTHSINAADISLQFD